jgi:hypothetical protein
MLIVAPASLSQVARAQAPPMALMALARPGNIPTCAFSETFRHTSRVASSTTKFAPFNLDEWTCSC